MVPNSQPRLWQSPTNSFPDEGCLVVRATRERDFDPAHYPFLCILSVRWTWSLECSVGPPNPMSWKRRPQTLQTLGLVLVRALSWFRKSGPQLFSPKTPFWGVCVFSTLFVLFSREPPTFWAPPPKQLGKQEEVVPTLRFFEHFTQPRVALSCIESHSVTFALRQGTRPNVGCSFHPARQLVTGPRSLTARFCVSSLPNASRSAVPRHCVVPRRPPDAATRPSPPHARMQFTSLGLLRPTKPRKRFGVNHEIDPSTPVPRHPTASGLHLQRCFFCFLALTGPPL